METFFNFLVDNYIWFLVITLVLVFALIGYLVDTKKDERFTKKIAIDQEAESRLQAANAANMTLNEMVKPSEEIEEEVPDMEPEIIENSEKDSEIVN